MQRLIGQPILRCMYFRICISSFFIFFFCINSLAQSADTVLYFSEKAGHFRSLQDSFYVCHNVDYKLWKLNGKTCMQKFVSGFDVRGDGSIDTALESSSVCVDSSVIHNYIGTNFNSIINSKIWPVIIKQSHDGRLYYTEYWRSHPMIYYLDVHLKDTVIKLEVDMDCVTKDHSIVLTDQDSPREKFTIYKENVNYEWNSSTALWKLMKLVKDQIDALEEKKQFRLKGISR